MPPQLTPERNAPALPAAGLTTPAQQEQKDVNPSQIAEFRAEAEKAELDEEVRKQILATYDQAQVELTRATALSAAAKADNERVRTAEEVSEDLQLQIGLARTTPDADLGSEADLESLQTEVLTRAPKLVELKRSLAELEAASQNINERRKQLADAQTTLQTRTNDAKAQQTAEAAEGENPLQTRARRVLAAARVQALDVEGPAITAELARITAESSAQISRQRIELARKEIALLEAEVALLKQRQDSARRSEATQQERMLSAIPPGPENHLAAEWLERNKRLVTQLIPDANKQEALRKKQREEDEKTEKRLQERVESLGVVVPVGMELQEQRLKLRDIRQIEIDIAARETELARLNATRLENEEVLTGLESKAEQNPENETVLLNQASILRTLIRNEATYVDALRNVDTEERQLVTTRKRLGKWLSELVLWVQSNEVLGVADLKASGRSFAWLMSPELWRTVPGAILDDVQGGNQFLYLFFGVLLAALFYIGPKCRKNLTQSGKEALAESCSDFTPTLRAAWLTVILSVAWPLVVGFIGSRLTEPPRGSDFSQSVGRGMQFVSVAFLVMNLLKQVCRNGGLGEAHFAWTDRGVRKSRLVLRKMMVVLLPLLFVATMLHTRRTLTVQDSLERICFILALLAWAWFTYQILNPTRGVFAEALGSRPPNLGMRTSWFWYPVTVSIPIVLAILATAGYFFTAYELSWRLMSMICLVGGLIVVQAFLSRWHTVHQRIRRAEHARTRQLAVLEGNIDEGAMAEEEERDLLAVERQTRRFINTALVLAGLVATWFIWSQVFHAVTFLNKWELWSTTRQKLVEQVVDGKTKLITETISEPVTLLSLVWAVFIALATITAARNLPGLLEVILLKRLPLEPALRYALRTVARYLIVIVGVTLTLSLLGLGWAKVQWLVAGLTVGLGFGLQEIFANFVSGLIILFERPVRLGDVVTIDGVSGTVSRIQIRATTITDWDRKEYIVPNKELVTGRVLNWTLTDKSSRIVVEVGVAYGTDTKLARDLLVEVAEQHPLTLSDPAPRATFEKFGDSTLNLVLRCFLPNLDGRLDTISDLHAGIDHAFAQAGIEIAFPQLDVHMNERN
jgi:potassium efflux system protein